ncbi:DUF2029 domain-containing protein [bacterium]|nr:DUF2029 domain-containing protein [bacterium]
MNSSNPIPARTGADQKFLVRILTIILLAVLVLQAVYRLTEAVQNLSAPFDTSYPECAVVERTLAVTRGEPLYGPTDHWPYLTAPYGPLTYYPVAWTARLIELDGTRQEQARRIYLLGRLYALLACAAILAWLSAMGAHLGLRGWARALPVLVFFLAGRILEITSSFRPDSPMVALALWAWWLAMKKPGGRRMILAAGLMALAFFHKHAIVLSASSLGIWLLWERRWKDAGRYGATFALLTVPAFLLLCWRTNGGYFENTVSALAAPLSPGSLFSFLSSMGPLEIAPLAGGLAACLCVPAGNARWRQAARAFLLTFLAAECLLLRVGSSVYYYLEVLCWGALLSGLLLHEGIRAVKKAREGALGWILVFSLALAPLLNLGGLYLNNLPNRFRPYADLSDENPRLALVLRRTTGQILTTEVEHFWWTRSPVTLMDPFMYSVRVQAGQISPDKLIGKLSRGDFQRIVLVWSPDDPVPSYQGVPTLPQAVVDAIWANYTPVERSGRYYICEPRP